MCMITRRCSGGNNCCFGRAREHPFCEDILKMVAQHRNQKGISLHVSVAPGKLVRI